MQSIIKKYWILGFLLLGSPLLLAQQGLEKDLAYFKEVLADYEGWLEATQVSKVLKVRELDVVSDALTLHLEATTKEDWFDMREVYKRTQQGNIGKLLLDKLAFQMSVGKDSVNILIECANDNYPISLGYESGMFVVEEDLPDASSRGMFEINLADLPDDNTQRTTGSAVRVKNSIIAYLDAYYSAKKGTWQKAKFSVIDNGNEVNFEISNIKKEVLDDFLVGYFELIIIDLYIEQKGKVVEVNYQLQSKYGSGIFVAPRRSGYKDMEPKYQDYVERYQKRFKAMIKEVLNAKKIRG